MKNLTILALLTLGLGSLAHASLKFEKMSEDTVSATLVEGHTTVHAQDWKVTAKLLTVYRGGAAGMSSVIITLLDQSPVPGDFSNANSYELNYVDGLPGKINLVKTGDRKYSLSFEVKEVVMGDDGNFSYPKRKVVLKITLDQNGAVSSVER